MGTKSKSAGTIHTPRGVVQGQAVIAHESGLPIDSLVDVAGVRRLAVDANININSATINVDLDSDTDSVAIRNSNSPFSELLIESDGSISIRLLDETGAAFSGANPLPVDIVSGIELAVQLDAVTSGDSVRIYGNDIGTQRQVVVDTAGHLQVDVLTLPNVVLASQASPFTTDINVSLAGELVVLGPSTNNIGDVDVLSLPAVTLASQVNPFTSDLPISVNAFTASLPAGTNNIGDVDVLTAPDLPFIDGWPIGTARKALVSPATGRLQVDIVGALPAGVNNIGSVNQGTSPWVVSIDQTGNNNAVDVLTLPNVLLASQASPFTTDLNVNINQPLPAGTNNIGDVDVLSLPDVTQSIHDNLNLNANIQVADADVTALNPVPVSIVAGGAGGTPFDVTTDEGAAGDGLFPLTGGLDVILSFSVPLGTTANLQSFDWACNRQCSIKLEVRDGGVLVNTIRAKATSPGDTHGDVTFPTARSIVGAAGRVIRVTAFRISGTGGFVSASINGFTV